MRNAIRNDFCDFDSERIKMGYKIHYSLEIVIPFEFRNQALQVMNEMHSDSNLQQYAKGRLLLGPSSELPVSQKKWYSWVPNPSTPYLTLQEAFKNWCIVQENVIMSDGDEGDFHLSGDYNCKWGQQDLLLEFLSPYLNDTEIYIIGEDGDRYTWNIHQGRFYRCHYPSPDSEDESRGHTK